MAALLLWWSVPAAPVFGQTLVKDEFRAASGYTFFAPVDSATTLLIDHSGKVVHRWPGSGPAGLVVYFLPNGHILRTGTVTSGVFGLSASSGGRIDELAWDGSLVWTYTLATDTTLRHHDIAPLPNGKILVIAWEVKTVDEAIAYGRDPAQIKGDGLWPEAIFEVRPTPPSGGEVVWEWHAWDHLVQHFDPRRRNYGQVAAHPELIDINFSPQTPDWLHCNAIAYNPALDQIVISSRVMSEIWVIDHSTTVRQAAGHAGGRSGKGGDLLYRWGNPQTYRAGGPADQRLFNQHGVHWIAPGLPGAGHLLVFNNGGARNYSSVDEIEPPVEERGVYARAPGAPFGPSRAVWTYGENAQPVILSTIFGGAQRLPNGNTLICASTTHRMVEVTPEGEVIWEVNIADIPGAGTFRSTRVPVNFEGLRGTDLFWPAPTIVNTASRMGGSQAPGGLVTALGPDLAGPAAATSVEITDGSGLFHPAPLLSASSELVDFLVPAEATIGPARATIRYGSGEQSADFRIDPVAPALFSANGDGKGVGAIIALRVTGSGLQSYEPVFTFDPAAMQFVPQPLPLGDSEQVYLLLFGTGIRNAKSPEGITVSIGGLPVSVIGAAAQSQFIGLDQVNVGPLPVTLAGSGEQPVVVAVEQRVANTVTVRFQ